MTHKLNDRRDNEKEPYGYSRVEYIGPIPNTFAGGAIGGGLGALIGYFLAGPKGAAIVGGIGAFIGAFIGAQIDRSLQERREQVKV